MGTDPPWEGTILRGKGMLDNTDVNCAKTAEPIDAVWVMEACIRWVPDPHAKGQ